MHSKHDTVTTPMGKEYESTPSIEPSGKVCKLTEKQATVPLPTATPGSIPCVVFDENASLPEGSIRRK